MHSTSSQLPLLVVLGIVVLLALALVDARNNNDNNNIKNKKNRQKKHDTNSRKRASERIVVHLVPHSHDDTGWLKTVDEYSYGLNLTIQPAWTNAIFDSVISNLRASPSMPPSCSSSASADASCSSSKSSKSSKTIPTNDKRAQRKFSEVEIAFFSRWFEQQTPAVKQSVREVVANGQLTFALGAHCMPDEANTHFNGLADAFTLGHRWIKKNVNGTVNTGWACDPFGHASSYATLLAMSGLRSSFFARISWDDYNYRAPRKEREFWWSGSPSSLPNQKIMAGVLLDTSYGPPSGFRWSAIQDVLHAVENRPDDFIVDDHDSPYYNVDTILDKFYAHVDRYSKITLDNNLLFTMGSDFEYMMAASWYVNLDKLVAHVNARTEETNIEARYSTIQEYTDAKIASSTEGGGNFSFPSYDYDFFPYADGPHAQWSGYFRSRAANKIFWRRAESYWATSRQWRTMFGLPVDAVRFGDLQDALGIAQHHDSITGTAKEHVSQNYAYNLHRGYASDVAEVSANFPFNYGSGVFHCLLTNQSECAGTKYQLHPRSGPLPVLVWNAQGSERTAWVEIPVPDERAYARGERVLGYSYVFASPDFVTNYQRGANPEALPYTLACRVRLPAAGFAMIYLSVPPTPTTTAPPTTTTMNASSSHHHHESNSHHSSSSSSSNDELTFSNGLIDIVFSNSTGLLKRVFERYTNIAIELSQSWCTYDANVGDDVSLQPAGAYIFRNKYQSHCVPVASTAKLRVVTNAKDYHGSFSHLVVVEQDFGFIKQRITLRDGDHTFSISYTIFAVPVDLATRIGTEVMIKFATNISNVDATSSSSSSQHHPEPEFYTDSNARDFMWRKKNWRPWPTFNASLEPVAGNIYPTPAASFFNSSVSALGVVYDSAAGTTSLAPGELYINLQRRILVDDLRGVFEPLNETEKITSYDSGYLCFVPLLSNCGKHYGAPIIVRGELRVVLASPADIVYRVRDEMAASYQRPELLFFNISSEPHRQQKKHKKNARGSGGGGGGGAVGIPLPANYLSLLSYPLDEQLLLMTLQLLSKTELLVRLAHKYAAGERYGYPRKRASVVHVKNLKRLFSADAFQYWAGGGGGAGKTVTNVDETILTTITDIQKNIDSIHIEPMAIKTLIFTLQ